MLSNPEANISEVKRTKRQKYEYVFGTSKGLFFGIIDKTYQFHESKDDLLLADKDITNFIEYEKDKFVVSIYKDLTYIMLVDRNNKDNLVPINHPSGNLIKAMQLQQVFSFPFVLVRDEYNVSIIDIHS